MNIACAHFIKHVKYASEACKFFFRVHNFDILIVFILNRHLHIYKFLVFDFLLFMKYILLLR